MKVSDVKVLKRNIFEIKLFNRITIWRYSQSWESDYCVQRVLSGMNYEAILEQLKANPHFLEFEFAIEGATTAKQIAVF